MQKREKRICLCLFTEQYITKMHSEKLIFKKYLTIIPRSGGE